MPAKVIVEDEHPRASSTVEALQKLKPLNDEGIVTAGNASGINDGAAALIIGSKQAEEKLGFKPIAKILSSGAMGVEPTYYGRGSC